MQVQARPWRLDDPKLPFLQANHVAVYGVVRPIRRTKVTAEMERCSSFSGDRLSVERVGISAIPGTLAAISASAKLKR